MFARWMREPLLQFLVVGVVLFGAWSYLHPDPPDRDSANRIVLTDDDLKQLTTTWVMAGRPPPSPLELNELVADKVREEVLYREALALGLDKDDTIVRRQLARKMEFLAEDVSKLEEPKPGELKAWFEKNSEQFASAPRITFRHVYFSPDSRGAAVRTDAERGLAQLAGKSIAAPGVDKAGDPFMFQQYYGDRSVDEIARQFGPAFARALVALPSGAWAGPIESGYGWHVVFIESFTPERIPAFEEVQPEVRDAWVEEHRKDVKTRMYEAMRARYEVVLPPSLVQPSSPASGAGK